MDRFAVLRDLLRPACLLLICTLPLLGPTRADEANDKSMRAELTAAVRKQGTTELLSTRTVKPRDTLWTQFRLGVARANQQSSRDWRKLKGLQEWQAFSRPAIAALRRSLGEFPDEPPELDIRTTATFRGDGFQVDNVVFRSRSDLWITANLYRPLKPAAKRPGIVICHSHHTPKTHGELQDMGMMWARAGCTVVVMDQLGHGERREHPFHSAADYPDAEFRVSRQDYYFRYDTGVQLHLAGQSLIGQIAWDLRRGVDLLVAQDHVDPERIVLLGSVAGGGDPVAVAGALDQRFAVVAPFNFGGPQPETRYPLPEDIERTFNYAGGGSWESTRNLQRSGRGGFLPWVIVGSIAPRRLIYAHEFNWHRERDPVWKRLQQIYQWHDADDRLDYTHGFGELRGRPPAASHCTHIGKPHRRRIHAALNRWLNVGDESIEYSSRRPSGTLRCWDDAVVKRLKPRPLHAVLAERLDRRYAALREAERDLSIVQRRERMRDRWTQRLVDPEPGRLRVVSRSQMVLPDRCLIESLVTETEPGVAVPISLFLPPADRDADQRRHPVVLAIGYGGRRELLQARAATMAALLNGGVAVCAIDVRGTGETRAGDDRSRRSSATGISSAQLLLGTPQLAGQLRDVRAIAGWLRSHPRLSPKHIGLWGFSLRQPLSADQPFRVPHGIQRPAVSEPAGSLLALLTGLYEPGVKAIYTEGGIPGWGSVFSTPFVYLPHDIVVPGMATCGDISDLVSLLAPTPVAIARPVDGVNRLVPVESMRRLYSGTGAVVEPAAADTWFLRKLRR